MTETKGRPGKPGELRPGGTRSRIAQDRSPHDFSTPPRELDIKHAFEPGPPLPARPAPSKEFGQPLKYEPKPGEKFSYQTLREGRLMRIGIVGERESDDQTQYDLAAPRNTVVKTYNYDKGSVRVDPDHGNVNWRYAPVSKSSRSDLENKPTWIGWTQDAKGQFTKPLMHPDAPLTLGLEEI